MKRYHRSKEVKKEPLNSVIILIETCSYNKQIMEMFSTNHARFNVGLKDFDSEILSPIKQVKSSR